MRKILGASVAHLLLQQTLASDSHLEENMLTRPFRRGLADMHVKGDTHKPGRQAWGGERTPPPPACHALAAAHADP